MKLHVITHKEAVDQEKLADKVVVVFDCLLATTTIVAALNSGAESILPVKDAEEAREKERELDEQVVLAGEWKGQTIEGFIEPSPFILNNQLKGKRLILSSTNGTRAIRACIQAKTLYIGSLLNASAVADWLSRTHQEETVLLVCSGSEGQICLEDVFGAGVVVHFLKEKLPLIDLSDAAKLAWQLASPNIGNAYNLIKETRVGQMMKQYGMDRELQLASQIDRFQEIPVLVNQELINLEI